MTIQRRRKSGRRPAGIALALLLAACTGNPTPYQPAVAGYGYMDQQLEENRYRVSFAGNELTPPETVQNYLLYRAAEITLESGFDYFSVVDRNLDRSTTYWGSGQTFLDSGYVTRHGDIVGFGTSSYSAHPIDRYTAYADVVMFEGQKPPDDVNAYDARDVLRRLDPTIEAAPGVMRLKPDEQQ